MNEILSHDHDVCYNLAGIGGHYRIGAVLHFFALAMIWGVMIGTYSSIFVAVGFLSRFDIRHQDPDDWVMPELNDHKMDKHSDLVTIKLFNLTMICRSFMATVTVFD